jgi:hypothetical protein
LSPCRAVIGRRRRTVAPTARPTRGGCLLLSLALTVHAFTEQTVGTGWWPATASPLDLYVSIAVLAWLVGLGAIVRVEIPGDALPLAPPVGWLVLVLLVAAVVLIA